MSTGAIPINLPPANTNTSPGATTAATPIAADPHVTRDANLAARAITATDKSSNPVNDKLRQRDTRKENSETRQATVEQQAIQKLQARDRAVKSHEQAHLAAAGNLARAGANYTYQRGPDGKQYAIGGEVSIDSSAVPGDPEATIKKAQQIRRAAQAPVNPSAQDRQVAAQASAVELQARAELEQLLKEQKAGVNQAALAFAETEAEEVNPPPIVDTFA